MKEHSNLQSPQSPGTSSLYDESIVTPFDFDVDHGKLIDDLVALRSNWNTHHQALGFRSWDIKSLARIDSTFEDLSKKIAHEFGLNKESTKDVILKTLKMNPLVSIVDGLFNVSNQYKSPLVETLSKLIAPLVNDRFSTLEIALKFKDGSYFLDGNPINGRIFPKLVSTTDGSIGNTDYNYWSPTNPNIQPLNPPERIQTQVATQRFFRALFNDVLNLSPKQSSILEVGPGWGSSLDLLPEEYHEAMNFLEWNQSLINIFTDKKPSLESKIQQGNAYKLSNYFKPDSQDVVFGLTAFSSFTNLDHIVSEAYKVLKPGGYFISVHDSVIPNDTQVADELSRRGLFGLYNNFWFDDVKQRAKIASLLPKDPTDKSTYSTNWQEICKAIHENCAIENMYEYFYGWMELELAAKGMDIILPGREYHGFAAPPPSDRHPKFAHNNSFISSGYTSGPFHFGFHTPWSYEDYPYLQNVLAYCGKKLILEHSVIWMVVGRKPLKESA